MKNVEYKDERGRKFLVRLGDDVPDEDAHMGIPIGPPDIADSLGYPEPFATKLHNILYDRKLWSLKEVNKQKNCLKGVIQAALQIDVHTLHNAYNNN